MSEQKPREPQNVGLFSIDHWQDSERVKGSWLDSPIWGVLLMCVACMGIFVYSTVSNSGQDSNHPSFPGNEFASPPPVPSMPPNFDDPNRGIESILESRGMQTPPSRGVVAAQPKGDVSALLNELIEAEENGRSSFEIKQELSRNGCNNEEIVTRLCQRLEDTTDARKFEKIILALSGVSYVISDKPDFKSQFVNASAKAGKHVKASQLKEMDQRVQSLILDSTRIPEGVDLLGKLASIDRNWGSRVLTKLYRLKHDQSAEISVQIARQHKIDPSQLRDKESEVVCRFLWDGKLAGKKEFLNVSVGNDPTSVKAFANAATSKIASDPSGAVDALMALSLHRNSGIKKETLPKQLVEKIDDLMSVNIEKRFVDTDESFYELSKKGKKGTGPVAFLDLAQHLGGKKTTIAIGKMGNQNPSVLQKFRQIRDILLTVNEPEIYDAIAHSVAFHGSNRSKSVGENIGQAIEPNFVRRLQAELESKPSQKDRNFWVAKIRNLVQVLDEIGTIESMPVLEDLAGNKNGLLKGIAENSLKKIRRRSPEAAQYKSRKPVEKGTKVENGTSVKTGTIKVTTDSGEAFKSSVSNIVQGQIPRSSDQDKLSFDPANMWHSDKLETDWATVDLEFPDRVMLDRIQIYSQHTGKNHLVIAAQVFAVQNGKSKLLCESEGLKQRASFRFQATKSKKWRLKLKAGESKKIVVRGLRFYNGTNEIYAPSKLPPEK